MMLKHNKLFRNYIRTIILYFIKSGVNINSNESLDFLSRELDTRLVRKYIKSLRQNGYICNDENNALYSISEKGEEYIENNKLFVEFFEFASPYFTLEEFCSAIEETGEKNFEMIMITMFEDLLRTIRGSGKHLTQRNLYEELGDLYYKNNNVITGVKYYLSSLYLHASGVLFLGDIDNYINGITKKNELINSIPNFRVTDIMINNLRKGKSYISKDVINEVEVKHKMRVKMCSREEFSKLLNDILNGKYDATNWKNIYNNKYKKIISKAEAYKLSMNN